MKKHIKLIVLISCIAAVMLFGLTGWFIYEANDKITFIGKEESQDGRTAVTFQMRGTAGKSLLTIASYGDAEQGRTKGRALVERDGEWIKTEDFTVNNQGEPLQEGNWEVQFYPAGVEILLHDLSQEPAAGMASESGEDGASRNMAGEEQHIVVLYDEENLFAGYSEEEVAFWITDRYDNQVSYLQKEGDKYYFQADDFTFSATNDFQMTDDYEESYFAYLAQQFSYGHNRVTEFEKRKDEEGEAVYVPVVGFNGRQPGELEAFSNACCDLVEELQEITEFEEIGYFSEERRRYLDITPYLDNYDRTKLYNAVYRGIEQDSLEEWRYEEDERDGSAEETSPDASSAGIIIEEMPEEWREYEAECSYKRKDGTQLRMVGVDRAAGSSFYVLLEAVDGINTSVINADPYLGHGGLAKWIDFLEDERIGFSCLAYSGGSLGRFFRTEDGGRSFQEITYPSAKIELPDGSLYNPFIMPDRVWEEEGKLYMMAGQGPDGDYYEDGVWVYGLYESEDMGRSWSYVGTAEGEDYRW